MPAHDSHDSVPKEGLHQRVVAEALRPRQLGVTMHEVHAHLPRMESSSQLEKAVTEPALQGPASRTGFKEWSRHTRHLMQGLDKRHILNQQLQ